MKTMLSDLFVVPGQFRASAKPQKSNKQRFGLTITVSLTNLFRNPIQLGNMVIQQEVLAPHSYRVQSTILSSGYCLCIDSDVLAIFI